MKTKFLIVFLIFSMLAFTSVNSNSERRQFWGSITATSTTCEDSLGGIMNCCTTTTTVTTYAFWMEISSETTVDDVTCNYNLGYGTNQ